MARVYVGIGSNLGDRKAQILSAVARLDSLPAITVLRRAPLYATAPVGVTDQPEFLNTVIELETTLAPHALLEALKQVERDLGRTPTIRWGPRTVDLDILFYDDLVIQEPSLVIPHPRLAERAFVLVPLADLVPALVVCGRTVADLASRLSSETDIRLWEQ